MRFIFLKEISECTLYVNIGKQICFQIGKVIKCHFPDLEDRISCFQDSRKRKDYSSTELVVEGIMNLAYLECIETSQLQKKSEEGNILRLKGLFTLAV